MVQVLVEPSRRIRGRFEIWTTGDRPSHVAKAVDAAAAETALKGIAAIGTNALINTMAEASQALPSDENHRARSSC